MYILRERRPTEAGIYLPHTHIPATHTHTCHTHTYLPHLPVSGLGSVARHDDAESNALALLIHLAGTQLLSISLCTSLDRTKMTD